MKNILYIVLMINFLKEGVSRNKGIFLRNVETGLFMGIDTRYHLNESRTYDNVELQDFDGTDNQRWSIECAFGNPYLKGQVLTIRGNPNEAGNYLYMAPFKGIESPDQMFEYTADKRLKVVGTENMYVGLDIPLGRDYYDEIAPEIRLVTEHKIPVSNSQKFVLMKVVLP